MNNSKIHIIPFNEACNEQALEMEKNIVQGGGVQLEIIKSHFLSRARVFKTHYACLAFDGEQEITGAAVAAETAICLNGDLFAAGFAFDTKVVNARRKKGIGHQMAKHLYSNFFKPQAMGRVFMTAKAVNLAVLKLSKRTVPGRSLYPFVYMVIPSSARLPGQRTPLKGKQLFHVQLFDAKDLPDSFYTNFPNGLGCFYTCLGYRLTIKKIDAFHKAGIALLRLINPSKYAALPHEGDQLSCAALYAHNAKNITGVNAVLEKLENEKIDQLLVCCCKGDVIYTALKKLAIYTYSYFIASDFSLRENDDLTIDARCL